MRPVIGQYGVVDGALRQFGVQLAGVAVGILAVEIVDAVGDVRGLLYLGDKRPGSDAVNASGRQEKRSPGCISYSASRSVMVLSATLASYWAGVTCLANPERRRAPLSASTTYHISVLPFDLWRSHASASFGCTWIERSCRASMNLISSGNSCPKRAALALPSNAAPWRAISPGRVVPASGPPATTDSLPLTPESSQLSPTCFWSEAMCL